MFNFQALIKYLLEGMAVALAAFFIPQRRVEVKEIVLIALTAAAVFAILDQFTPAIGASARQGAGFGIGLNQVGWGGPGTYDFYGGENTQLGPDKVTCTCEVDADTLRQRVCPVHTAAAPAAPAAAAAAPAAQAAPTETDSEVTAEDDDETASAESDAAVPAAAPAAAVPAAAAQTGGLGDDVEPFDGFSKHF